MALLVVGSVKGRPGVTTVALGLAAAVPPEWGAVVVECDPAGGDLMRRHNVVARPSVVDLAAAARAPVPDSGGVLVAASQLVFLGDRTVRAVVAPAGGAQTRAALPELTRHGASVLRPVGRLVVADCGRLDAGSAARPLLGAADVVLLMARARAEELAHLREHLAELVDLVQGRLVVVLAPGGMYPAGEVGEVLARFVAEELARDPRVVSVWGPLPTDRRAAGILDGDLVTGRRWRRLPLMVAVRRLSEELSDTLSPAGSTRVAGVAR